MSRGVSLTSVAVGLALLAGCGDAEPVDVLAEFSAAATTSDLSMRERAYRMEAIDLSDATPEVTTAVREAADRCYALAEAYEAFSLMNKRREANLGNDMAEYFFRGLAGDPFGKTAEVVREDSAMRSRAAAAEEAYFAAVGNVERAFRREAVRMSEVAASADDSDGGRPSGGLFRVLFDLLPGPGWLKLTIFGLVFAVILIAIAVEESTSSSKSSAGGPKAKERGLPGGSHRRPRKS